MSQSSADVLAWDRLFSSTNNAEIRKIMKRKMKSGVKASKFKSAFDNWQKSSTRLARAQFKKQMKLMT